ncbi:GNAT family N-acetyltransferase [Candidatus Bipolaricaulota bacterium]
MPKPWRLRPLQSDDVEAVRAIFNYYVAHSFAAYPEVPLSADDIRSLLASCHEYPALAAEDEHGNLIGFGFLRPYSPHDTFATIALITYFIDPTCIREGLGSAFLQRLESEAQERGITHLLAHVASRNENSLAFHRKHGFRQCGTFHGIGCKHGEYFDIVWFEKSLDASGG